MAAPVIRLTPDIAINETPPVVVIVAPARIVK